MEKTTNFTGKKILLIEDEPDARLTQIEGVSNIIRFIRAGACDYINKPFDIQNLRMRIERALELESTLNTHFMNVFPPEVNKLIL